MGCSSSHSLQSLNSYSSNTKEAFLKKKETKDDQNKINLVNETKIDIFESSSNSEYEGINFNKHLIIEKENIYQHNINNLVDNNLLYSLQNDENNLNMSENDYNNNYDNQNDNLIDINLPLLDSFHYTINYELGEGSYGKIFYGKNIINGKEIALKFFGYTQNKPLHSQIIEEMNIMSKLSQIHSLPQIYGYFMDSTSGLISGKIHNDSYPVLVMELLDGIDLFEGIYERRIVSNERDIARIFRALLSSLDSIHKLKFIHRDIKLENLMISKINQEEGNNNNNNNILIKIIDCGSMIQLTSEMNDKEDNIYRDFTLVGTPGYIAPESLQYFDYSFSSDIWQLGCCLYSMLSGTPAFSIRDDFMRSNWRYNPMIGSAWNSISSDAKDLVHKMLQRNPCSRPSIQEILDHPWITTESCGIELGDSYFSRVKYLALRQKMKNFFLDTKVMEKGRDRRKKLKKIIPLLRQMSSCSWNESTSTISPKQSPPNNNNHIHYDRISQNSNHNPKLSETSDPTPRTLEFLKITPELFENKLENFKGAVMQSIIQHSQSNQSYQLDQLNQDNNSSNNCNNNNNTNQIGCLDYETFARLMIESDLSTLSSRRVFNIFDIDRKGVINMKDFLLTMAALHPTHSQGNSFRHKWKWPSSKRIDKLQEGNDNETNSDSPGTRQSRSSFTPQSPTEEELTDNMSRYYFDIFDIHNRGYIDIEQLKLSIGCFLDYSILDTSNRSLLNQNINKDSEKENNKDSHENNSPINSESERLSNQIDEMDIESLFRLIDTEQTGKINYEQFSKFFKDLRKSMS